MSILWGAARLLVRSANIPRQCTKQGLLISYRGQGCKSFSSDSVIAAKHTEIELHDDHLHVAQECGSINIHYLWLRDHCRCSQCYNHITKQRRINLCRVPMDIHPSDCEVKGEELLIKWYDGHVSNYQMSWLSAETHVNYIQEEKSVERRKWRSAPSDVAHVPVRTFLDTDWGLQQLVESLIKFGVGFVEEVHPSLSATAEVIQRLGPVQRTLYGDIWELKNSQVYHDTAYSTEALGAHTDNTYLTEAAGLQIFHCLEHDGKGGETLLVDGFRAADDVKERHPESYNILTSTYIESEYLAPGYHHSCTAPVLCLHPVTRELQQVRFNLYDRAPMRTVPHNSVLPWYRAMRQMAEAVQDPDCEWWLKLNPGCVLFVDNWRVLHGRSAFTGTRYITGSYISRTDYLSRARVCGALSSKMTI